MMMIIHQDPDNFSVVKSMLHTRHRLANCGSEASGMLWVLIYRIFLQLACVNL